MPRLLLFFQADCPTCRLIVGYANALARGGVRVTGVSQDGEAETRAFVEQMAVEFPVVRDVDWEESRVLNLVTVPSLVLVDDSDRVRRVEPGFDKQIINELAALRGCEHVASPFD